VNPSGLAKSVAALIALAMCTACGGGSGVAPSAAAFDGMPVTTLVPKRHSKSKTFEYIINGYGTYSGIFDYPKSDKEIGKIHGVGGQGCANVLYGNGKDIFWIVAGPNQITEFKVLKTPIKTLSVSVGQPSSCAMDTSGDLAVGILSNGDVVIFPHATGSGTVITTPLTSEYFDGYDNHGNLFADGFNASKKFGLVELPAGSSTFQTITTSNTVMFPGSVQWDGTYLTVTDQIGDRMYRYTVSGTTAMLEGTVSLAGSSDCAQTWIGKGFVYCADAGNDDGEVFNYPAGGKAVAVLTGAFATPLGVVSAER
jgi:hypothetical protein